MKCLDDNTVLAFVERLLPPDQHDQIALHLDGCEACLTITCAAARSAEAPSEPAAALEPGQAVGRYSLVELIGQGGMGSVYVAHDPQLDRKIALKVVRSARFAQPDVRERLSREARAMAKVTHAHVVTVFDAGELADGVFIAMELVDGETLGGWLARQPRSWRDIVGVFVAVGRGLAAAHAAGVVHRDFKPDNVLVDRVGRAAVTDFGLALANDPARASEVADISLDDTHALTRTGALLGTPRFMSPEQLRGETADARSDQFSFATALYAALYRTYPFAGATVGELHAAMTGGTVAARPDATDVPVRVHAVLIRALATDPAARFPSMAALLDELVAATHRRRTSTVVGLALVCALGGGAALWASHGSADRAPASKAGSATAAAAELPHPRAGERPLALVQRFANTTGDPRLDDTLDVAVEHELSRSTLVDPYAGVELEDMASRLGGDVHDADGLIKLLRTQTDVPAFAIHGSVARAGAGYAIALDAGSAFHAQTHADDLAGVLGATAGLADQLRVALGDRPEPGKPMAASVEAVHAWLAGMRASIGGDDNGALQHFEAAIAADPAFADAHASLGLLYYNASKQVESAAELERALHDADRMPERRRLTVMGDYYGSIGHYKESIAAYQQLLARWPKDVRTQANVTATALDAGDFALGYELARISAADHSRIAMIRGNLVLAEVATDRFDEAARDGAKLFVDFPTPPPFAAVAVAVADELLGHHDDARAALVKLDASQPDLAETGRADLDVFEGDLASAERRVRGLIATAIRKHDASAARMQQLALARILLMRGDHSGAANAANAAMGEHAPRPEYLAASIAVDAGREDGAAAKAAAWQHDPLEAWRIAGKLLESDLARAHHRAREAVAAAEDASRIGSTWIVHARLARAYADADQRDAARREVLWCQAHRGEGAVFMSPSLALVFELEHSLGARFGRTPQR